MTNSEVCRAFARGYVGHSSNMFTDGNKLFSYSTVIAEKINGAIVFNASKYSTTTSKQQTFALREFAPDFVVNGVSRGITSLVDYL